MKALEAKKIKGLILQKLLNDNIKASITNSNNIVFFTDKAIDKKSIRYTYGYITSFGKIGAYNFLKKSRGYNG